MNTSIRLDISHWIQEVMEMWSIWETILNAITSPFWWSWLAKSEIYLSPLQNEVFSPSIKPLKLQSVSLVKKVKRDCIYSFISKNSYGRQKCALKIPFRRKHLNKTIVRQLNTYMDEFGTEIKR